MYELAARIRNTIAERQQTIASLYLYTLFLFFTVFLLSLSIKYTDSDLWYHLEGGEYFFTEFGLYNPFVSSYLDKEESFINYFWMFQVFAYSIHTMAGYAGLVISKAGLFLLCGFFATRLLLDDKPFAAAAFLQLFVIALVVSVLCYRGISMRPHLFSFCFIALFIYILLYREKLYALLPLLTVGWVNFHGIEYVVGALICGSFFLHRLIDYLRGDSRQLKPMLWIASCLPAMMINPHGVYVMLTPFIWHPDIDLFILELGSLELEATIDFSHGITLNTLVLILFGFWIAAAVTNLRAARENLAPLLLALGGLILLSMGKRFIWEWMLLSTPMLARGIRDWPVISLDVRTLPLLLIYLIVLVAAFIPNMQAGLRHYPIDEHSLPHGTTEFIKAMNITGKYAIEPTYAGYVEFHLSPDVQVHSDMQFPPFTNLDYFEIANAVRTASGLTYYVNRYRPDLIGAMKASQAFPDAAARSNGYLPVFFDRKVVLYIDSHKYPSIAEKYELKHINPFNEDQIALAMIDQGIIELEKMITVVDTPDVSLTLIGMLIEQRDLKKADLFLSGLRERFPDNPTVQYFSARVFHLQNNCLKAIPYYEATIETASDNAEIHLHAAECYFLIGDQLAAYEHYRSSLNPYTDRHPDPITYYQYALSAYGAGHKAEAMDLLTMTRQFGVEGELATQIEELLKQLRNE